MIISRLYRNQTDNIDNFGNVYQINLSFIIYLFICLPHYLFIY